MEAFDVDKVFLNLSTAICSTGHEPTSMTKYQFLAPDRSNTALHICDLILFHSTEVKNRRSKLEKNLTQNEQDSTSVINA